MASSSRIRKVFLDFFLHQHGHQWVPSSCVLPHGDSSLLFTNAGMNQFKSVFLGTASGSFANLQRVANSQKCVRVGGKHSDLDDVGKDGYHHTFFEMLGNWSFGDYFTKEACEMAWELLTGPYNLPPGRLYVTYFGGDSSVNLHPDEECRDIWRQIGVSPDHILPFGMKDNFWDMGDTGPCGPCTEIHYSHRPDSNAASLVNAGLSDMIELWNLVFIQYNRQSDGSLKKLTKRHVDTGMGLERLVAVLNGSTSNYNTDVFLPLFDVIQKETRSRPYGDLFGVNDVDGVDTAYRIVADHARMCTVSISDGLLPDEVGAGHCLRKVIRRSVLTSRKHLRSPSGLLKKLSPCVAESLESAFPDVSCNLVKVEDVIQDEEDRFLRLLERGSKLFDIMKNKVTNTNIFSANYMWELYFVHGIPEEVILDLASSAGLIADVGHFKELQFKEQSKTTKMLHGDHRIKRARLFNELAAQQLKDLNVAVTDDSHKYDMHFSADGLSVPTVTSEVVAMWDGEKFVDHFSVGSSFALITEFTNFYAEAGGQTADIGFIRSKDGSQFEVQDVIKVDGYVVHHGTLASGTINLSDVVELIVDEHHREGCTRNHTATHLLNAALRTVLDHTDQKSSHVMMDGLRFDFTAKSALSKQQLSQVESFVTNAIQKSLPVRRITKSYEEIRTMPNLVTLPGEVYPDVVSVIVIQSEGALEPSSSAISLEPCCGTHLNNTGAIQDFVIYSQKPQAQRIRSIHAITGPPALKARELAEAIDGEISSASVEIAEFESRLNQGIAVNASVLDKELSSKRAMVAEGKIPLLVRSVLDRRIEELQSKLVKILRTSVQKEIQELCKAWSSSTPKFIVHLLISEGDDQVVLTEAVKRLPKIPYMIFASRRSSLSGRCFVPKDLWTVDFNAEIWAKHMLQCFPGDGWPYKSTPSLDYVFRLSNSHKVAVVLDTACQFAECACPI